MNNYDICTIIIILMSVDIYFINILCNRFTQRVLHLVFLNRYLLPGFRLFVYQPINFRKIRYFYFGMNVITTLLQFAQCVTTMTTVTITTTTTITSKTAIPQSNNKSCLLKRRVEFREKDIQLKSLHDDDIDVNT